MRSLRRGLAAALSAAALTACWADDPPTPTADAAAPGPTLPVTSCPTPSLVTLYPDPWPPDPYGPKPAADACVAAPHDAIIVLGCPNDDDGAPSACQEKRADLAIALSQAGFGARFITTGGAVHNSYVEAFTIRDLLVQRGASAYDVFTDDKARHTDENIYYSTAIMNEHGWTNALVVSDDPGHLMLTTLCDANCCVEEGRLTVYEFPLSGGAKVLAGHYALYPYTPAVAAAECAQLETPTKFMCVNLASRLACKGRVDLP